MKTQKIDHTPGVISKLTPDYEISCSLLEPIITGQNPIKLGIKYWRTVIKP